MCKTSLDFPKYSIEKSISEIWALSENHNSTCFENEKNKSSPNQNLRNLQTATALCLSASRQDKQKISGWLLLRSSNFWGFSALNNPLNPCFIRGIVNIRYQMVSNDGDEDADVRRWSSSSLKLCSRSTHQIKPQWNKKVLSSNLLECLT